MARSGLRGHVRLRVSVFVFTLLILLVGLVMLVTGAEMLVRGGGAMAMALRVPALVVGLTIVAFGTSTPELMVSITAALSQSTEMALANVNGSNIANIALVLGAASLTRPLTVERTLMRREIPFCFGLQLLVPLLCIDGSLTRFDGVLLLLGGVIYNTWLLYEALRGRTPVDDDPQVTAWTRHLVVLVGGLVVLIVGANLFVEGAVGIAERLHLSDRFIGLTVVALGTSAPEVATAIVSARRGEVDLAVGNSLGSNLLNISMVLGITAIMAPIHLTDSGAWTDMAAAMCATLLLLPFVLKGSMSRIEGGILVTGYAAYLVGGYVFGDATIP